MKLFKGQSVRSLLPLVLPWTMVVIIYAVMAITAPGYRQGSNIAYLLMMTSVLALVAMGQLFVILIGGIDLSVSSVMTITNLVSAVVCAKNDQNLWKAVLISLVIGAAVGLLNGFVITKLGVPDMVATLATYTIVFGLGYFYSAGRGQGNAAPLLVSFLRGRIFGFLPPVTIVLVVLAVVVTLVLRRSTFGRQVYAVGLSRGASHAAGISITRTTVLLYVISGLCASVAGVLLTGTTGASVLGSGSTYQLMSIAAVVLGGANIFGGSGGYGNTIAGAGILTLLVSLLLASGIPTAAHNILYGVVILIMLVVFRFSGNQAEQVT